ncbi:MAG: L,D-transpeptidase family protein [Pseudomonadota bacterium]
MVRYLKVTVLVCLSILSLHSVAMAVEPQAPQNLISRMDAVGIRISNDLTAKFKSETKLRKKDHGSLVEFYSERNHKPIWVDENGLTKKAKRLITEIKKAGRFGLSTDDYDLPADNIEAKTGLPADWLALAELKLSYAGLAYARDAKGGRMNPSKLSKYIDIKLNLLDPLEVITELSKTDQPDLYLANLHPKHEQFRLLMAILEDQRLAKKDRPIEIPAGPTLRLGDKHEQVPLLRKRLRVVQQNSDYADNEEESVALVFDEALEEAVRDFQASHGLKPDGAVGQNTRHVMNGKPKDKVKTIIANMERWRWLPDDFGAFHIRSNIPEFKFSIYQNGKSIHSERVISGKITNQTPIFNDYMETVVLNPYWYPPRSIIKNEILPGARRNESFISKHSFQVRNASGRALDPYDVDWYNVRPADLSFRQPPGPRNVLGVVKFLFPNKHAVYMHDTPTKHLFKKPVRAYSHGCVRVRNPRKFAEILLSRQGWTKSRLDAAIATGENQHVRLKKKVPVYLTYFTASVDPATGDVKYFNDIYKHDARVIAKLEGRPVPRDPIDPVARRVASQEREISRSSRRRYDEDRGFFRRGFFRREARSQSQWDEPDFNPFDF